MSSVASSKGPGALLGTRIEGEDDDLDLSISTEKALSLMESLESWDLNPAEIQQEKELGKGSFGTVFLGKLKGQVVAVKKLLQQTLDEKSLESFKSEIEIMRFVPHN